MKRQVITCDGCQRAFIDGGQWVTITVERNTLIKEDGERLDLCKACAAPIDVILRNKVEA